MENPRTQTARDNDDRDLIEDADAGTGQADSAGGNLARDIASEAELNAIGDPDGERRVEKDDTIAHGTEVRPDRARAADS